MASKAPWKVSLHGGHSEAYCDHATGTLAQVLDAAVDFGYTTFGVTEHAPRVAERFLFDEEIRRGWGVDKLAAMFEAYAADLADLVKKYAERLEVLRAFEAEAVPDDSYAELMLGYRARYGFDYMVGSVHHIREIIIDGPPELFAAAASAVGGLEPLAVAYYEAVARMVRALRPEVVSHLDLIRRNAPSPESVETPKAREAAFRALDAVAETGAILDLNTAGIRKGLGCPYPRPWLVREAHARAIPFCFGDDSHGPGQVGFGLDQARDYLLENGVRTITGLTRSNGAIVRKTVSLDTTK
jgi:histidinol-phosphatase (PHP family)